MHLIQTRFQITDIMEENLDEQTTHKSQVHTLFPHKLTLCILYKHFRSEHMEEGNKLITGRKLIMQDENTFVTFFLAYHSYHYTPSFLPPFLTEEQNQKICWCSLRPRPLTTKYEGNSVNVYSSPVFLTDLAVRAATIFSITTFNSFSVPSFKPGRLVPAVSILKILLQFTRNGRKKFFCSNLQACILENPK